MTEEWEEAAGPDANLTPPVDKTALSVERRRLFAHVERINRAWLDSMREMRRAEAEFSVRLFSCNTRDGAMVLCDQWLAKRKEIIATEQRLFEESWSELLALLANSKALRRQNRKSGSADTEH